MERRLVARLSIQIGLFAGLAAVLSPCARARAEVPRAAGPVIVVLLDGVRRVDFHDRKLFPYFWKEMAPKGTFGHIRVDNPWRVSLPGYQSLFTGTVTDCRGNRCGRVRRETVFERVRVERQLPMLQVAAIASWEPLGRATERRTGDAYISAGRQSIPWERDPVLRKILREQKRRRPPWRDGRWDGHTWAFAKRYLPLRRPELLVVSFLDADKWAHRRSMKRYRKALRRYDGWLKELRGLLARMGEYGQNATILVTTDHGRGKGRSWWRHGLMFPHARFAWLFGMGPCTAVNQRLPDERYGHVNVRATIERILGLDLAGCAGCGAPIHELAQCGPELASSPRTSPSPTSAAGPAIHPGSFTRGSGFGAR